MSYDKPIESRVIGGVDFSIPVTKSTTKNVNGKTINCVWTDYGYMEFEPQPMRQVNDGKMFPKAHVTMVKNKDVEETHSQYYGVLIGDFEKECNIVKTGEQFEGGTYVLNCSGKINIDTEDGKEDYIGVSNSPNTTIVKDEEDTVKRLKF